MCLSFIITFLSFDIKLFEEPLDIVKHYFANTLADLANMVVVSLPKKDCLPSTTALLSNTR